MSRTAKQRKRMAARKGRCKDGARHETARERSLARCEFNPDDATIALTLGLLAGRRRRSK